MKRSALFVCIFLLISILLSGCSGTFDWDGTVSELEDIGLTVDQCYTTGDELEAITRSFNTDVLLNGGVFTVEVKRYTTLIKNGDYSQNCQLVEFATRDEAKSYADLYVISRNDRSSFSIARCDTYVIITNLDEAMQAIDLEFK